MRWQELFADLEAQAQALAIAERAAEVETRTRGEVAALSAVDRLRGAVGSPLRVRLVGGLAVGGTLTRVGPDWLLIDEAPDREIVVAAAQVLSVRGVGRSTLSPGTAGQVESRLGLRSALRGIARDRSAVRLYLADSAPSGAEPESAAIAGTLDRVGADFVEIAAHSAGEVLPRGEVRLIELVPLAAVAAVRRTV